MAEKYGYQIEQRNGRWGSVKGSFDTVPEARTAGQKVAETQKYSSGEVPKVRVTRSDLGSRWF